MEKECKHNDEKYRRKKFLKEIKELRRKRKTSLWKRFCKNIKKETNIDNGFIIIFANILIRLAKNLNASEWIKEFFSFWMEYKSVKRKKRRNYVIDFYILGTFLFSSWAICIKNNHLWIIWSVKYLIIANIFTYFYYHCWEIKEKNDKQRDRRRFITLIISFFFNTYAFSYLYMVYSEVKFWEALKFSVANSFAISNFLTPLSLLGNFWVTIQSITTFLYIAILLSQSIPRANQSKANSN